MSLCIANKCWVINSRVCSCVWAESDAGREQQELERSCCSWLSDINYVTGRRSTCTKRHWAVHLWGVMVSNAQSLKEKCFIQPAEPPLLYCVWNLSLKINDASCLLLESFYCWTQPLTFHTSTGIWRMRPVKHWLAFSVRASRPEHPALKSSCGSIHLPFFVCLLICTRDGNNR